MCVRARAYMDFFPHSLKKILHPIFHSTYECSKKDQVEPEITFIWKGQACDTGSGVFTVRCSDAQ